MITTKSGDPGQDNIGRQVRVVCLGSGSDFIPEARRNVGIDKVGVIVHYSNSHGLYYEVAHTDRTTACYNPEELMVDEAASIWDRIAD